jgi:hypothetical protein
MKPITSLISGTAIVKYYVEIPYQVSNSIFSVWKEMLQERIRELGNIKDNWDGYGAIVPSEKVINNTIDFTFSIPDKIALKLYPDNIDPTPNGTITLDWINQDDEKLSLEIGGKYFGYFTVFNTGDSPYINKLELKDTQLSKKVEPIIDRLFLA